MLRIFRIAGALAFLLFVSLDSASAGSRKIRMNQFDVSKQTAVVMIDSSIDPKVLKVKQGTTVEWINNGDGRTVAAVDKSFSSGVLKPGAYFQHRFERRGKFAYRCRAQKANAGSDILGTIVVTK